MAAPTLDVAVGGAAGPSNASASATVRVSLYVQKARQLLTYVRLVGRDDAERRRAAERRAAVRARWRDYARRGLKMAREERRQREREEERARAAAARGGVVSGRTRTARGEGDGRDYSEVRARAPNGSQEVAARVRGGHVTARTRIGVQLGRLIDTVRRSRKEAG